MTIKVGSMWDYLKVWSWCLLALLQTRGSLAAAAESLYVLNRYARATHKPGRKEWVYDLKNRLVQALYQAGYCVGAEMSVQRLPCWGTHNYDCDENCPKCGGTGIYRTNELYDFTFEVAGRRYRWHQPADLVTWPVELTAPTWQEYEKRDGGEADLLTLRAYQHHCFVAWWALKRRGLAPALPLLNALRFGRWQPEDYYGNPGRAYALLFMLDWDDDGWALTWPAVWDWIPGSLGGLWSPGWFNLARRRLGVVGRPWSWTVVLFGKNVRAEWRYLRKRLVCWRRGHDWRSSAGGDYCRRCYREQRP